uniref:Protein HEATR9 n=1 Tax=Castor canadensis TaxID=51338 RepID=A0A8C0ZYK0_CASCN
MGFERSVDIFEISRSMYMYPWLEYQDRTKELRKATAPVHLPLSCYQMPKEEYPPSPECWRQHPSKPNSVPSCYSKGPERFTHWRTLDDQRKEREMLQKMRDHTRYFQVGCQIQNFNLPMSKLILKPQARSGPLDPTRDSLKWQRLKVRTMVGRKVRKHLPMGTFALACSILQYAAQTGPEKVKCEAYRALAILGCLNKHVIQALIKQVKCQNEGQRMDTLMGLRVALNFWAAIPKDKRIQVGDEEELVAVLQMLIKKSSNKAAMEAALCLGFLRPCSNIAQEFLLQCLYQGPKSQQMKALRMLVKIMHVHSAVVTKAILEQLCSSGVLEDRFEATQMLSTIGLERIQAQGLEEITFDLLKRKTYNEPFVAMRQAVAKTVKDLKMKPMMMNLVEAQLMDPDAVVREEAVISLGGLGIRSPHVFYLLLDMLDVEENQAVKKSIQETLIVWASTDPWIQNKLKNKVFSVYEAPKTNVKIKPTRFRKEPEILEELNIQDFRLAKLNPLFISKFCKKEEQKEKVHSFLPCLSMLQKQRPHTPGPWQPTIRKQLQNLAENCK